MCTERPILCAGAHKTHWGGRCWRDWATMNWAIMGGSPILSGSHVTLLLSIILNELAWPFNLHALFVFWITKFIKKPQSMVQEIPRGTGYKGGKQLQEENQAGANRMHALTQTANFWQFDRLNWMKKKVDFDNFVLKRLAIQLIICLSFIFIYNHHEYIYYKCFFMYAHPSINYY
jgi:hypothetical protein